MPLDDYWGKFTAIQLDHMSCQQKEEVYGT